jgi:hypothetical protein
MRAGHVSRHVGKGGGPDVVCQGIQTTGIRLAFREAGKLETNGGAETPVRGELLYRRFGNAAVIGGLGAAV